MKLSSCVFSEIRESNQNLADEMIESETPDREEALSKLAKEEYTAFLDMFDSSRVSNDGLILALEDLRTM